MAPRSSRLPWYTRVNSPRTSQACCGRKVWSSAAAEAGRSRLLRVLDQGGLEERAEVLLEGDEFRAVTIDPEVGMPEIETVT